MQLGTETGKYVKLYAADTLTYEKEDLCSSGSAYKHPGYFHHARLTGLQPNTRYWVVPQQGGVLGYETTFRTAKPRGGDVASRFVLYGDQAITAGEGATATAQHITERVSTQDDLDFLLHVGDLSYGCGSTDVWNSWHDIIEPYSSRLPYLVSIGNHEYDYVASEDGSKDPSGVTKTWHPPWSNAGRDGGGECGVPPARRFRYPQNGNGVFWYSFDAGNVHVAMISSEHDCSPGSPLGLWLEKDLMGVDRKLSPWVIVGIHRPPGRDAAG